MNQYPEKLIPRFIKQLINGQKLTIHGTGETRRNFIWVEDVAIATDIITEKGVVNNIYNIGTTQEYSVLDVARLLVKKLSGKDKIDNMVTYVEDRPFNDFRYHLDCNKLRLLGWEPKYNDFSANLDVLISALTD